VLAPENTPFMVSLVLLALLALSQILGLGDSGGDAALDADGAFDGGGMDTHGALDLNAGLASLLGFGRLPLMAWLTLALGVFTLGGLGLQAGASGLTGHLLPALPAAGFALFGTLPGTALLSQIVGRIWPRDETSAISRQALLARRGHIEIGTAMRGNPARAIVRDQHGQLHLVMVEPHEDSTVFAQGEEVLLVRRQGGLFFAVPCDPPFLTGD